MVFKATIEILENVPPRMIFKPFICLYVWAMLLMEKVLHHLGCRKCLFYPSIKSIKTCSGIRSGAGFSMIFHSFLGPVFILMFPDRSF